MAKGTKYFDFTIGNDPLEFTFGGLVRGFSHREIKILCTLCHYNSLVCARLVGDAADLKEAVVETDLRTLNNRNVVNSDQEERSYSLVPLAGEFLRRAKRKMVSDTGR